LHHYPIIDPDIVSFGPFTWPWVGLVGPFGIRWYGLAYLAAFSLCWWLGTRRAKPAGFSTEEVSDIVFYGAVGAVLGGRIGYAFVYGIDQLKADPLWLVQIWKGGMSFHGGLVGVLLAMAWFARKTQRTFLTVADFVAPLVPTGLGFGRLGNFMNTELPGRKTDSIFGLVYPCSAVRSLDSLCTGEWEDFARHPSPLYQAFAEGLVLFAVVWWFSSRPRAPGAVSGLFLIGYGVLRFSTEFFREPDVQLGYVALDWLTMGQLLSLPMILFGIVLIAFARKAPA